jgi:AP-2 complex subunit alpha
MQVFIADIRNCQNKEQERTRVDKELGKIRKKFASGNTLTGNPLSYPRASLVRACCSATLRTLTDWRMPRLAAEYDRKKYVWKLLYIHMLGYEVEFGHKQAADLIPATK